MDICVSMKTDYPESERMALKRINRFFVCVETLFKLNCSFPPPNKMKKMRKKQYFD